jgi:hypothetical protein
LQIEICLFSFEKPGSVFGGANRDTVCGIVDPDVLGRFGPNDELGC